MLSMNHQNIATCSLQESSAGYVAGKKLVKSLELAEQGMGLVTS